MKYLNKIISFCNINSVSVYGKTLSVRKAKSGFTLAELMVCLTIIAVISTILIPTLGRVRPNKSKAMFKKAYNISERVVYELVNDQELYPTTDENVGIDNVWIEMFDKQELKKEFGLEDSVEPICLIPLGYRDDEYKGNPLHNVRKALDETVKFI